MLRFLFLISLGVFCVVSLGVQANESLLPPDAVLQQEAVWKNHRLKLFTSPPKPEVRGPVEIFLEAKKEGMETPFVGGLRLGVERIAPSRGALQETDVGGDDQEEAGFWRVTQIFQDPGVYAIRVIFTDPEGEISVLQGKIEVSASSRISLRVKIGLSMIFGFILLGIFFYQGLPLMRKRK